MISLAELVAMALSPLLSLLLSALISANVSAEPSRDAADYTWVEAVPPKQGTWPRYCPLVIGFDGKLWALETAAPQKIAFASADGIHWSRTPARADWGERYRPAVAFFKGKMWFLGGRSATVQNPAYHNDVWSSENGADWKPVTANAGWSPRWNHTALIFGGRLWIIGGFGYQGPVDDIWFTSDGVNWTRATEKAPWSRWKYRSFVVFRERIWAIGFHVGNDVWWSTDGAHWTQATSNTGWPASSHNKHAVVFDERIWVMGGSDAKGNFENDVWSSADGVNWERQTLHAPWFPRAANYSVVFGGKLWIYGGKNSPDDVWYLENQKSELRSKK